MKCNCPNCGRIIEVTAQEARRLGGHLVCPQCLTCVDVDVPAVDLSMAESKPSPAAKSTASNCPRCGARVKVSDDFCPKCGRALGKAKKSATSPAPPPYRRQTPPRKASVRQAAAQSTSVTASPRRQRKRANAKSGEMRGSISPLGCLLRTVALVLVAFMLYMVVGALSQ